MPGLEERFAAFPQLYSRVGIAHQYRQRIDEDFAFVLALRWRKLGLMLDLDDFTDAQAMTASPAATSGSCTASSPRSRGS